MKRRLSDSDSSMSNVGGSRRRSRKKRTGPAAGPSEVSSRERQQTLQTETPSATHEGPSSTETAPSLEANMEHQQMEKPPDRPQRLEENKPWIPIRKFPGGSDTHYLKYYIFSYQKSLETSDAEWAKTHQSERECKTRELLAQIEETKFTDWASEVCLKTLALRTVKEFEEKQLYYLLPFDPKLLDYESLQQLLCVVFFWCFGDKGLEVVENRNPRLLVEKIRKSLRTSIQLTMSFERIRVLADGVSSSHAAFAYEKLHDFKTYKDARQMTKEYLRRLAVTAANNTSIPDVPQQLGERFQSKLQSIADIQDLEAKAFDMVFPEFSDFKKNHDSLCAWLRAVIQIFESIYRMGNVNCFPGLIKRDGVILRAFEVTNQLQKDVISYRDFYKALNKSASLYNC